MPPLSEKDRRILAEWEDFYLKPEDERKARTRSAASATLCDRDEFFCPEKEHPFHFAAQTASEA